MAKQKNQLDEAGAGAGHANGFPIPFPAEAFKRDIVIVYVHKLREMAWMGGATKDNPTNVWQLLGYAPEDHPNDLYNPDATTEHMGVTWEHIKETDFAKYLFSMYEYGCHGIYDLSLETMEDESCYTWMSHILVDLKESAFLDDWCQGYSGEGLDSVERCHEIAELANARRTLEAGQYFSPRIGANSKEGGYLCDDQLTVRQLALLSGMEEMSIRAAANPNRPNPLPTIEEERREKRTRFALDVAKSWLQSKGRYVPITHQHKAGDIDLAKRKFPSVEAIWYMILERKHFLRIQKKQVPQINQQFDDFVLKYGLIDELQLGAAQLANPALVRDLADILQFPADLFALRVRETLAKAELIAIERQLRELAQAGNK